MLTPILKNNEKPIVKELSNVKIIYHPIHQIQKNKNQIKFHNFHASTTLRMSITNKKTSASQMILLKHPQSLSGNGQVKLCFSNKFLKNHLTSQFQIQALTSKVIQLYTSSQHTQELGRYNKQSKRQTTHSPKDYFDFSIKS